MVLKEFLSASNVMRASEGNLGTSFLLFIYMSLWFESAVIAYLTPPIVLTLTAPTFYPIESVLWSLQRQTLEFPRQKLFKLKEKTTGVCICFAQMQGCREGKRWQQSFAIGFRWSNPLPCLVCKKSCQNTDFQKEWKLKPEESESVAWTKTATFLSRILRGLSSDKRKKAPWKETEGWH